MTKEKKFYNFETRTRRMSRPWHW